MPKLPRISGKKLLRILLKNGFIINRQSGSHVIIEHSMKQELVTTIPLHANADLPLGTLLNILRDLEINKDDLISMLR